MLLVHDHQPQIGKTHRVAQHGMCADDHLSPPLPKRILDALSLRRPQASRQEDGLNAPGLEQSPEPEVVLLGQNFGRRHKGRLKLRIDGSQNGCGGDERLAGADVSLEKPVHRGRGAHILEDLGDGSPLRPCRGKT